MAWTAPDRLQRARERLARGDADGFIDLFEVVTLFATTGRAPRARELLLFGREETAKLPEGAANVIRQIEELEAWMTKQEAV